MAGRPFELRGFVGGLGGALLTVVSPWPLLVVPRLLPVMVLHEMLIVRSRQAEIDRGDFRRWH